MGKVRDDKTECHKTYVLIRESVWIRDSVRELESACVRVCVLGASEGERERERDIICVKVGKREYVSES